MSATLAPILDVRRDPSDGNIVLVSRPAPLAPSYHYQADRFSPASGRFVTVLVSPDRATVAARVEIMRREGHRAIIARCERSAFA